MSDAVDQYYNRIINEQEFSHFFERIDLERQRGKMKAFLAYAFGAPLMLSYRVMKGAENRLPVCEVQLNAVIQLLKKELQNRNLTKPQINELMQMMMKSKSDFESLEQKRA